MASEMPRRIFRNFNCFLDKESYLGQCSELDLPEWKEKMDTMVNAGMVAEMEVSLGVIEKLDAKAKMPSFDERALKLFGLAPGVIKPFMFTGAFVDEVDGLTHSAIVHCWGRVRRFKPDNWKVGDKKLDNEWEIAIREFKLEIDGQPILEITPFDVRVGGVSQFGNIQRAILA